MNINPNKIYATYRDDDGHTYLIPYQESLEFFKELDVLEKRLNGYILSTPFELQDEELVYEYQQDVYDLLDKYDRLEGESYYVILEEDLEG